MEVTQMPPVRAANLVANSGNTAYGVDVIMANWEFILSNPFIVTIMPNIKRLQ